MKYEVWSSHRGEDVLELTRTVKRVAQEDCGLIRSITGRRTWIEEVD